MTQSTRKKLTGSSRNNAHHLQSRQGTETLRVEQIARETFSHTVEISSDGIVLMILDLPRAIGAIGGLSDLKGEEPASRAYNLTSSPGQLDGICFKRRMVGSTYEVIVQYRGQTIHTLTPGMFEQFLFNYEDCAFDHVASRQLS